MIDSQAQGTITPDLYVMVCKIAHGVRGRYPSPDPDDDLQEALVRLLESLHLIDPDGNVFGYVTQVVKRVGLVGHRDRNRDHKRLHKRWAEEYHRETGGKRRKARPYTDKRGSGYDW